MTQDYMATKKQMMKRSKLGLCKSEPGKCVHEIKLDAPIYYLDLCVKRIYECTSNDYLEDDGGHAIHIADIERFIQGEQK